MIRLIVNGRAHDVAVDPDTPLLWVLREQLGLTGTKFGCGASLCGACMVQVDGMATTSCTTPVAAVAGRTITTIEGLAEHGALHRVQQVWAELDVPQCGYCQSGMIIAVAALLDRTPKPTDRDIDVAITNICRCGTQPRVRAAIHQAAGA